MKTIITSCYLILISLLSFSQGSQLKVGSIAPDIKIAEWIKGKGAENLEKEKVSIIEFTILGCNPCIKAIPHLSALYKKYEGKMNLISIFANGDRVPEVKKLVSNYDSHVSYPVAVDMPDNITNRNWMLAAGRAGYPTVFVIDRQGRIAWIGNPLAKNFDSIVESVYSGTFLKEQQVANESNAEIKVRQDYEKYIKPAEKGGAKELAVAVEYLDSLIELDASKLYDKFRLLLLHDEKAAFATLRNALNQRVVNPYYFSAMFDELHHLKDPDWLTYRSCCKFLYDTENKLQSGAMYLGLIAESYYVQGLADSALLAQDMTIAHLKKYNPEKTDYIKKQEDVRKCFVATDARVAKSRASVGASVIDSSAICFLNTFWNGIYDIDGYNQRAHGDKGYMTYRSINLWALYGLAYNGNSGWRGDGIKIVYDVKDYDKVDTYFINSESGKLYNYNLVLPADRSSAQEVMKIMQRDLMKTFGYKANVVDEMPVWKLTIDKEAAKMLRSKFNWGDGNDKCEVKNGEIVMQFKVPGALIRQLSQLYREEFYRYPIIDETAGALDYPIDLTVKIAYKNGKLDIPALQQELKRHGLQLQKTTAKIRAIVVSEVINNK